MDLAARIDLQSREPAYARPGFVLFLLATGYLLSFLDRQILVLMIKPIQRDFGLTDTSFSLLYGFAFALFYTVLGLAFGRIVDGANRVRVLALCILLWSAATFACGLAETFPQLFVARMLVGVGEAGLAPAAYSLIADLYSPSKRPRAFALFTMGMYLGSGLAFAGGGQLVAYLDAFPPVDLPVLGEVRSWQLAFFLAGAPGIALAMVLALVREPRREQFDGAANAGTRQSPSVGAFLAHMRSRWPAYLSHHVGFGLHIGYGYAISAWLPVFYMRVHGIPTGTVGLWFGLAVVTAGPLGAWIGSAMVQRANRAGITESQLRLTAIACVAQLAAVVLAVSAPSLAISAVGTVVAIMLIGFPAGLNAASLQIITPATFRGQAGGLFILISNLLGLGLGPLIVALLTDRVYGAPTAVGWSLATLGAIALPAAFLALRRGSRHFAEPRMAASAPDRIRA